jgi:hypothetical protein
MNNFRTEESNPYTAKSKHCHDHDVVCIQYTVVAPIGHWQQMLR